MYLDGGAGDASVWTNTVFNENLANTSGGALYIENHDIELRNNHFLTNDAADGGALYLDDSDFELINSVMAWTVGGDGIEANWATSGTYTMDYNNWYSNTSANYAGSLTASSLGSNSIFVDPDLEDYTADGDCTNDKFWPATTSPLIDAGDPSTIYNDLMERALTSARMGDPRQILHFLRIQMAMDMQPFQIVMTATPTSTRVKPRFVTVEMWMKTAMALQMMMILCTCRRSPHGTRMGTRTDTGTSLGQPPCLVMTLQTVRRYINRPTRIVTMPLRPSIRVRPKYVMLRMSMKIVMG